ncbi:MAG TPA: ectonucleotide pyrophosphatase/phosphodiesterase [Blastocatellia bacterium]|jgi:predicted AlkP superfamily pyrophosphatase or phosphodiesterase|nr:ectonucleotide pyrophosphatase/phosphodiesterase [Blastocatellia bacterium]
MRKKITLLMVLAITALLLTLHIASAQNGPDKDLKPTVILVSIDGFHPNYLDKYPAPTLSMLARQGVRAKWMTPVYPSLTFPNHYSIATGLYPDRHGIVGNNIYDPEFKETFSLGKREEVQNGRWWLGEPIWVTAEKQGQRAAAFFFPGTEAEIAGKRPSRWKAYDDKITNSERIDTLLSWFDLPDPERPTLILTYFGDVDHAGHESGPDSDGVRQAVAEVDKALNRLVDGLKSRKIFERVNIIIVSDHGMARIDPNQVVFLDDYFDQKEAEAVAWNGCSVNIFPKPGMEQAIYSTLKSKAPPHVTVYRRQDAPTRFHYSNNRRIGDIVVMADEGWTIFSRELYRAPARAANGGGAYRGTHGYDNRLESMRAIFIAHGPAFKQSQVVEPFENVGVYNVMAEILGLKPASNDGGYAAAKAVLLAPK